MDQPSLLDPLPAEQWMDRLREGDQLWCVKQQTLARVGMPWEPPAPGYIAGRLVIQFPYGRTEIWYVNGHGNGMDNSPLVRPLAGSLAPVPWPSTDLERREVRVILIYLLAFQMRFKPEPRAVPFTCDDCGSPVIDKDMLYASWAEYKRLCKLCDACKEAEDAEMPDDEDSDDEVEDSDDWEEVDDEVEDSDDEEVDSDYFDDQSVEVVLSAGCVGANDESETDWRKRRPRAGTLSVRELQEIARIDYARYLQTEHWQAVRKARNRRANYRCEKCKADNPRPRVHHRSYERIGCELLEDVISYCNKCHESEHDIEKMKAAGVIKS